MERRAGVLVLFGSLAIACGSSDDREKIGKVSQPVAAPLGEAFCTIQVTGVGAVDAETDYLPHVIQCENGGANFQALKAQAIAARSVVYYDMSTKGAICDGQACQVYSCGATPTAEQVQAVKETSGQYLSHNGMLTYGFYVAGDNNTAPPSCVGVSGTTEKWITYNEGKSGADVQQTDLGFIGPPDFGQNRGCMGQWGARCLENNKGYNSTQILQFYYGADIGILTAPGPCVTPTTPELEAKFVGQGSDAPADDEGKAAHKVCAGADVDFWFELENIGTASWVDWGATGTSTGQQVKIGVPDDSADPLVGKNRISVNENTNNDVHPASSGGDCNDQPLCRRTVFSTGPASPAKAPTTPGVYATKWKLVDEGRGWFGPEMSLTFNVVACSSGGGGATGSGGTGGKGGGNQKTKVVEDDDGGCGCRVVPTRGLSSAWIALGLASIFGLVRRRARDRRSRAPAPARAR